MKGNGLWKHYHSLLMHSIHADSLQKHSKPWAEAKQAILDLIDINESVATGGSVTLTDSGILSLLGERGNDLYSIELNPVKTMGRAH